MEREILFRGKQKFHPHNWIYGLPQKSMNEYFIFNKDNFDSPDNYEVDSKTIGQYTGLTDKEGVKIFEGDILKYDDRQDEEKSDSMSLVVFYKGAFQTKAYDSDGVFLVEDINEPLITHIGKFTLDYYYVIGNIHDNPELLNNN